MVDKMERKAQPSIKSVLRENLLLGSKETDMIYKLQPWPVPDSPGGMN